MSASTIAYPSTRREELTEDCFGMVISDPYRWLENDARVDSEVNSWVEAQNLLTSEYLRNLPGRDILAGRLRELLNYRRSGLPIKRVNRYFYLQHDGLADQPVLLMQEELDGPPRILLNPNDWTSDGTTALAEWEPSYDGKFLAYALQEAGSDWRTVQVLDVQSCEQLGDELRWVKFSSISWSRNGSGFFYSRFDEPASGKEFQASNHNQQVYFHLLGTPQRVDRLVYETPDRPLLGHKAEVSDDGKWLLITSSQGTDARYEISVVELSTSEWAVRTIIAGLENDWNFVGHVGQRFYFRTDCNAPRGKIVILDLANDSPEPLDFIPQGEFLLQTASLVGGNILAHYLVHASSEIRRFDLKGRSLGLVRLPGIGTANGFAGRNEDCETFFAFSSFTMPPVIYRYDTAADTQHIWKRSEIAFAPEAYEVDQQFFASRDGTLVPMFIVRKAGVEWPAPTILYGYGGFSVSQTPGFSASRIAWLEQGGVFVVANIRGGGEYGKDWHDGGRLASKQNSFDDFIAAAEYLIGKGFTTADKLVVQGGSNGGLLVAAVVNQRPDLFAAALPAVGVMDMLRFDRFTAGRYWVDDYGSPAKEEDFRTLRSYSPYHNIREGKAYPAILATTADTDDRVVPGHSFKYTAALQAANLGPKPRMVRIETNAGHGSGTPISKTIAEYADLWAFAARWTGMTVADVSGRSGSETLS